MSPDAAGLRQQHRTTVGDQKGYEVGLAANRDIQGILDLQEQNLPDYGGTLSVRFPGTWFKSAIAEMPVIAARREGKVVGYLVSSPLAANQGVAIVQAMLRAYSGAPDAYIYGPICVDKDHRRRGLARAMFGALRARLPGREGICFIRQDNEGSLRAHLGMGMRQVAEFSYDGVCLGVLAYVG